MKNCFGRGCGPVVRLQNEWMHECGRKQSCGNIMYYPRHLPGATEEYHEKVQPCCSRDSNWALPEYISEEIPLYSLAWYCIFITSATFRLSVTHIASVDW